MDKIILNSHAKINLSLDVCAKRDDGYHEISTVMLLCGLCDSVMLEKAEGGIEVSTNLPFLPCDERNIAYKAARAFFEHTGIRGGVRISISKRIPVGAGLAGGSGNGAAVLDGLNRLYETEMTADELCDIGVKLGADVPYCICGGAALAEGIGERLTRLEPVERLPIVIVKPPFGVSTPMVYAKIDEAPIKKHPNTEALVAALKRNDVNGICENMVNVMEEVTVQMHPVIGEIKAELVRNGALGALMSGSGPSVFGIFESYDDAKRAAAKFRKKYFVYTGWTR